MYILYIKYTLYNQTVKSVLTVKPISQIRLILTEKVGLHFSFQTNMSTNIPMIITSFSNSDTHTDSQTD